MKEASLWSLNSVRTGRGSYVFPLDPREGCEDAGEPLGKVLRTNESTLWGLWEAELHAESMRLSTSWRLGNKEKEEGLAQ